MTRQEIFDTVAQHLLTQGCRSLLKGGRCAYRGQGGMKCAIGVLIPDELYTPDIEGSSVGMLLRDFPGLFPAVDAYDPSTCLLIRRLQEMHDVVRLEDWREQLAKIASRYDLSPAILEGFPQ